jgi:hypothetical protein
MAIPKIIHYCWFGGAPKPALVLRCIESWHLLAGYTVIEWNEQNFDVSRHPYARAMHEGGKFAFVSDFVRLQVLRDMGGIYFDTDLEVKKAFPDDFLAHRMFLPFQYDCALSTAIIGAEPAHPAISALLALYDGDNPPAGPNNAFVTHYFLDTFSGFRLNNRFQQVGDGIAVYPKEYFDCPTNDPALGYSVHHAVGSWLEKHRNPSLMQRAFRPLMKLGVRALILVLGESVYAKCRRHQIARGTEFYPIYLRHKKGN